MKAAWSGGDGLVQSSLMSPLAVLVEKSEAEKVNRLKTTYNDKIIPLLMEEFSYTNIHQAYVKYVRTQGEREGPNEAMHGSGINQVTHGPKALQVYVKRDRIGNEKEKEK